MEKLLWLDIDIKNNEYADYAAVDSIKKNKIDQRQIEKRKKNTQRMHEQANK